MPIIRTCPDPIHPKRTAWRTVVTPLTSSAAKAAPSYVGIRLPGNPGHNDHGQDHWRHNQHCGLKAGAKGYRVGRNIVRFVADVLVCM